MNKAIIGRKLGMTQLFTQDGKVYSTHSKSQVKKEKQKNGKSKNQN